MWVESKVKTKLLDQADEGKEKEGKGGGNWERLQNGVAGSGRSGGS